jgi:hypothetical protein
MAIESMNSNDTVSVDLVGATTSVKKRFYTYSTVEFLPTSKSFNPKASSGGCCDIGDSLISDVLGVTPSPLFQDLVPSGLKKRHMLFQEEYRRQTVKAKITWKSRNFNGLCMVCPAKES